VSAVNLMHGDCLERMAEIPAGSVDAIICDPPYGTIDGADLKGWTKETCAWDTPIDPAGIFAQANRLLRKNGALILFSQEPYTSRLITSAHADIPFAYRCVWLKDHFANPLMCNKAPVSLFEDVVVFFKKYDTLNLHPLRAYAARIMGHIGLGLKEINARLGHRRAEHFFYVKSTQFGVCTEETYTHLADCFHLNALDWFLPYADVLVADRKFNRVFNLEGATTKSNVLQFKKDYTGMHPTQKPVALMEYLIKTYTNEGETVLDNCMGSGTTGVACINTDRRFIGIERDPEYFRIASDRIADAVKRKDAETEAFLAELVS
jgi:site-specific DNA-methyltransferase (adenine-specific)